MTEQASPSNAPPAPAPGAETIARIDGITWLRSRATVAYPAAVAWMEAHAAALRQGEAGEAIWLLEHPPVFTAGTSARADELLDDSNIPVFRTGRGGRYTYHGPGQRVVYTILDLDRRGRDVRRFVNGLECWTIAALARLGVRAGCREGRIGVWVETADAQEAKIAAIGIRVRRWVSYHGIAINVDPDLEAFSGIIPCGLADFAVTSLVALGVKTSMKSVDDALMETFTSALNC